MTSQYLQENCSLTGRTGRRNRGGDRLDKQESANEKISLNVLCKDLVDGSVLRGTEVETQDDMMRGGGGGGRQHRWWCGAGYLVLPSTHPPSHPRLTPHRDGCHHPPPPPLLTPQPTAWCHQCSATARHHQCPATAWHHQCPASPPLGLILTRAGTLCFTAVPITSDHQLQPGHLQHIIHSPLQQQLVIFGTQICLTFDSKMITYCTHDLQEHVDFKNSSALFRSYQSLTQPGLLDE